MYTYTRAETELCIDSLNVEGGKDSALWLLMVKAMHDKPAYVQT